MTNKQRKQALELLFFDPEVAFSPPMGGSYLPNCWMCTSCHEYSPEFKFGKVCLEGCDCSGKGDDVLTWLYYHHKDDPRPVKIDATTGEVITENGKLDEFHAYLKDMLKQHATLALILADGDER